MKRRAKNSTKNKPVPALPLDALVAEIRACMQCAGQLPFAPKPVVHLGPTARLMITGQAPGTKVHATGIPWNDASGDNLRGWLAMEREAFYDATRIAILPVGLCYPGRLPNGGDAPPRPECAPLWHNKIRMLLPDIRLTLLIGQYAQAHYLGGKRKKTLTETVRAWRDYLPLGFLPLVHPSPRNRLWMRRNPWFEKEAVPALRREIRRILKAKNP